MVKEKVVSVRMVSYCDPTCVGFCRGCVEVDLWVVSPEWKTF